MQDVLSDKDYKESTTNKVSIATAAAVNAYARVYINQIKLYCIYNNIQIYYSDTDSIITNHPLPSTLVGKGLGQFKLVNTIKRGYFISPKLYYCVCNELDFKGKEIIVSKGRGGDVKSLNERDFCTLIVGGSTIMDKFTTKGSLVVEGLSFREKEKILLRGDSYNKRTNLYLNNVWTNTEVIEYSDQSCLMLVIWTKPKLDLIKLKKDYFFYKINKKNFKKEIKDFSKIETPQISKIETPLNKTIKTLLLSILFFICIVGYLCSFLMVHDETITKDYNIQDIEVTEIVDNITIDLNAQDNAKTLNKDISTPSHKKTSEKRLLDCCDDCDHYEIQEDKNDSEKYKNEVSKNEETSETNKQFY